MRCSQLKNADRHKLLYHTSWLEPDATNRCVARKVWCELGTMQIEGETWKLILLGPADERKACLLSVQSHPKGEWKALGAAERRKRRVWILSRSTSSRLGQMLDRRASCVSQRKWGSYTTANQFPNSKSSLDKTESKFSSQVLIKRSVPNSTNTTELKKQQLLLWIWLPGDTRPQSELVSHLCHELH